MEKHANKQCCALTDHINRPILHTTIYFFNKGVLMKNSLKIIPASFLICAITSMSPMAKVNIPNGPITPLHQAAFSGHVQEVRQLLAQGANVHARNCFGRTPLHDAVESLSLDTVTTLLSYGADPNVVDDDGMTPFLKPFNLIVQKS
jgi:hypothetical protein